MGFGNTRPSLAKLIMTRGGRKSEGAEVEEGQNDKDSKPLSSTQKLNVDSVHEAKPGNDDEGHTENKNEQVPELLPLSIDPTYNTPEVSPDLAVTPPSPKGEQQCFFGEGSRGQASPPSENSMLKGLLSLIGKTNNENIDRDNSNLLQGSYRKSFFSKHLSTSSTNSFSPRKTRKDHKCDESTYLMLENSISEDWSERQLAFDLESVTEDTAPIWMISPDEDDEDVTLSAPPFENGFDDQQYGDASSRRRSHRSFRRSFDRFSPRLSTVFELPSEDDSCCEVWHQSLDADTSNTSLDEGSSCYEEECGI